MSLDGLDDPRCVELSRGNLRSGPPHNTEGRRQPCRLRRARQVRADGQIARPTAKSWCPAPTEQVLLAQKQPPVTRQGWLGPRHDGCPPGSVWHGITHGEPDRDRPVHRQGALQVVAAEPEEAVVPLVGHVDQGASAAREHHQADMDQPEVGDRDAQEQRVDGSVVRQAGALQVEAAALPVPEGRLDGLITIDKFCFIRYGRIELGWWRRPLRLREGCASAQPPVEAGKHAPPIDASGASGHASEEQALEAVAAPASLGAHEAPRVGPTTSAPDAVAETGRCSILEPGEARCKR